MGYCYTFYRPWDMKVIGEGNYAGMPFFYTDLQDKVICFPDDINDYLAFIGTGIMDRNMALEYQKVMTENKTLFTDLMDENNTDCLIYRIT